MAWVILTLFANKGSAFLAQLFLGWILAKDDFALYAIAISSSALIVAIQNGGASKLLIQSAGRFDSLAGIVFRYVLLISLFAAILLSLAAPSLARHFDSPELVTMIWILAASVPLNAMNQVPRAGLSTQLRFGFLAKLDSFTVACRHGLTVLFAVLGFGAISFVLPVLIVPVVEMLILFYCRAWPKLTGPEHRLTWARLIGIITETRWIMLGAIAIALVSQGDYFVIGSLASKEVLAIYFFGFQLSSTFSQVFTTGIDSVLMPTFSRLNKEPARQAQAFARALRILSTVCIPLSVGVALLLDPIIRIAWMGKWDESIFVSQVMVLALSTKLLGVLGRSLIQSLGRWRLESLLLWIDAFGTIVVAAIGASLGTVFAIALSIAVYRCVMGTVVVAVAITISKAEKSSTLSHMAKTFAITAAAAVFAIWLNNNLTDYLNHIILSVITIFLFFALHAILAFTVMPATWREIYEFRNFRRK